MKKLTALLCAALMLLALLAGCGSEEDEESVYWAWYSADLIDLYDAPDLVLEEQDGQRNVGGWLYGNIVGCDLEFPQEDD